jgi:allantoinase
VFLPDLVVRSRRVVTHDAVRPAAIHVRRGKIAGIVDFDDVPAGCLVDDVGAAAIVPGVVDTHVHANEPGQIDGASFETTTRAAAAGGVTTIVDMPFDGTPATTTVPALEAKRRAAAGRCHVDVGFWGGSIPTNSRDLAPLLEAGVLGFKCVLVPCGADNFPPVSEADLRIVMPVLTRLGATLLVHAELPGPIDEARARRGASLRWFEKAPWTSRRSHRYSDYLASRPKSAEDQAVILLSQLCREYRTRTHLVHLSSSDSLTPLFHARSARLPMTAETCPHYLSFVADEIPDGTSVFLTAPPIRERENREYLWAALASGLVQMVASDHAVRQRTDTDSAACGLPSLPWTLSAMWTGARARGYSLEQVADWMCRMPAQLAGLNRKGKIEVGYEADLVVFDPEAELTVELDLLYKERHSVPYVGRALRGVVERTYLRGIRIYSRDSGHGAARGTFVNRGAI